MQTDLCYSWKKTTFFDVLFFLFLGSKEVLYAGDVHSAKEETNQLIRFLGFTPVDRGALRNAREIEDIPVQRFPLWKWPLIVSLIVFGIFFILGFTKFQICWTLTWDKKWHWGRFNQLPVTTVNSTLAVHALNMLGMVSHKIALQGVSWQK